MILSTQKLRLILWWFIGGILILPWFWWPWAVIPFEVPKVWLFERWVEGLWILSLVTGLSLKRLTDTQTRLLFILISFVGVAFVASLLGVDFGKSLLGNYYRRDGLNLLIHLVGFSVWLMSFFVDRWEKPLIVSLGIGSIGVSVWALMEYIKVVLLHLSSRFMWEREVGVSFGNPNFLAGYLLVTIPFVLRLWGGSWARRIVVGVGILIQIGAIVVTGSWAALLGVVLFFTAIVLAKLKSAPWVRVGLVSLLLFSGLGWWLYRFHQIPFIAEGRERIVRNMLLGFSKRPVLGWGFANADYAFESGGWPYPMRFDVYVDKAHGQFLEILVTTGIVGLAVYLVLLVFIVLALCKGFHRQRTLLFSVLLLYLFHAQTNVLSVAEEMLFWLVVGWATTEYRVAG